MSTTASPCAACKLQRRKCTQECVFAPYFPPDQPQKFETVHKVFGASNVSKILNDLSAAQREDAVNSLAYEAEARLRDPVYGCVGLISILQHRLKQVQIDLYNAKKELAAYIGPSAMFPILQTPNNPAFHAHQPSQQQILEAQQMAAVLAAREQQEVSRFNQMNATSLGLGSFDPIQQISPQEQCHQIQIQSEVLVQQQPAMGARQQERIGSRSEEGRGVVHRVDAF
ncbi:LOB domain-containing protein 36-like [Actinidia eriantha]|uniref:LOB domain-containing protein 36-like n=1 Tax=Actinidia eriantha TaxID=165200 RepID=UPI0025862369|nr:LOB domain-containing protein 36-like [Actinidia eriantha]